MTINDRWMLLREIEHWLLISIKNVLLRPPNVIKSKETSPKLIKGRVFWVTRFGFFWKRKFRFWTCFVQNEILLFLNLFGIFMSADCLSNTRYLMSLYFLGFFLYVCQLFSEDMQNKCALQLIYIEHSPLHTFDERYLHCWKDSILFYWLNLF